MNGIKRRALIALGVAVFVVAPMTGTADAAAGWRSELKKEHSARVKRDRVLEQRLSQDEDTIGFAFALLSCFGVVGTDVETFIPPGAVNPISAFTLSQTSAPILWTATVADECVDTSAQSARARAFRASYFPHASVR